MTGRFFRREISWDKLARATGLVAPEGVAAPEGQFNIAPNMHGPILRPSAPGFYEGDYAPHGEVIVHPAFWSLVPVWWQKPLSEKKFSTFNARAETLRESKTFAGAFSHGRCLVPASGYYAWSGEKGAATPFAIACAGRDWFCFAGLWSRAMIDGSQVDTFAIVTTAPNALAAGFSSSMPVILREEDHHRWINPAAHAPERLLVPYPAEEMAAWPAHPDVGNVHNQGAEMMGNPP